MEAKSETNPEEQWRAIVRMKETVDIRATVPSSSLSAFKKEKQVLQLILPQLNYAKLSKVSQEQDKKLRDRLLSLDEMRAVKKYKFGVLFCKEGQFHENEMFGNGIRF
jgi:hypothetical protein